MSPVRISSFWESSPLISAFQFCFHRSKTALNQITKTLSLEVRFDASSLLSPPFFLFPCVLADQPFFARLQLHQKKSSSISLAYHPGTTKTNLSSPFVSSSTPSKPEQGLFEVEESVEKLVALMKTLKAGKEDAGGDSGGFRDWKGERIVW